MEVVQCDENSIIKTTLHFTFGAYYWYFMKIKNLKEYFAAEYKKNYVEFYYMFSPIYIIQSNSKYLVNKDAVYD